MARVGRYIEDGETYKRFLAFAYMQHYPGGGMGDVQGEFDTLDEAVSYLLSKGYYDYMEVFDLQERRMVWEQD